MYDETNTYVAKRLFTVWYLVVHIFVTDIAFCVHWLFHLDLNK